MSDDREGSSGPGGLRLGDETRSAGRPLTVFLPISAPSTSLLARALTVDPSEWLPLGVPQGTNRWLLDLRLGPLHRTVIAEVGQPVRSGQTLARALSWWPPGHADNGWTLDDALPRFDGELILLPGRAVLVLDGTYRVPGGRLGEVADGAALAGLARRTGSALLADIIERATEIGRGC